MASDPVRYTTHNFKGSSYFQSFIRKPLEERKQVADNIICKFPDRIPVLIDRIAKSNLPVTVQHKFLVPKDVTVGLFMIEIRKSIQIGSEQAMFLFVNGTLPSPSTLMSTIYLANRNEDGFLYVMYSGENVFG